MNKTKYVISAWNATYMNLRDALNKFTNSEIHFQNS
jgi:hypothetical protein